MTTKTQRAHVEIWLTRTCPFCIAARRLLDTAGIQYEVHDLTEHPNRRAATDAILKGHRTVPLVVIDGEPIGGFTELERLAESDGLARRVF
ncbi:MAG: glutaredoxin [Planctomycetes bacterium]|nr:glutaredoxin [Planctomycetota bacterium]